MKLNVILLAFSVAISASCVKAQDEPAEGAKAADVKKNVVELRAMLEDLQAQLEQATAEAATRAKQLKAKEQALAEKQKVAEAAVEQAATQRKLAEESLVRADKAMAEAQRAKLAEERGVGQYKALLQLAEKKQGRQHAYSQTLRNQYQQRLLQLEMESTKLLQQFGQAHPQVKSVEHQANAIKAALNQLKQVNDFAKKTTEQKASPASPKEGAESVSAQLAVQVGKALKEADLATRYELAAKRNAELLQKKRIQELMEMQMRVMSAEKLLQMQLELSPEILRRTQVLKSKV